MTYKCLIECELVKAAAAEAWAEQALLRNVEAETPATVRLGQICTLALSCPNMIHCLVEGMDEVITPSNVIELNAHRSKVKENRL